MSVRHVFFEQCKEGDNMSKSKFYVRPVDEKVMWEDKKRLLPFGLPLTFTKYTLTEGRLITKIGFWKRREETIQLYRITDLSMTQSLSERICKVGTITIISNDATTPVSKLLRIKEPARARNLLLQTVEKARKENGISTTEIVGGAAVPNKASRNSQKE